MLVGCLLLATEAVRWGDWAGGSSCAIGPRLELDPLDAAALDAARAALGGGGRAAALDSWRDEVCFGEGSGVLAGVVFSLLLLSYCLPTGLLSVDFGVLGLEQPS